MSAPTAPSTKFAEYLFGKECDPGQLREGKNQGGSIKVAASPALAPVDTHKSHGGSPWPQTSSLPPIQL